MPDRFDPYHKWLGIPVEEQPPNHYRLLGVRLFESDADVISNAADQRMGLLKTFANGAQGSFAEDLLNEVSGARVCLLNPGKKTTYDTKLRECSVSPAAPPTTAPRGSWLPPNGGLTSSPEVKCPHCGAKSQYELAAIPQSVACRQCNQQLRVPGHEEVAIVAARLGERPAVESNVPLARATPELVAAPQPRIVKDEFAPITAGNIRMAPDRDFQFEPGPSSFRPDASSTVNRRNKAKVPPLFTLVVLFLGAAVGLPAGYMVLCVIDLRYDFLNLLSVDETGSAPPAAERKRLTEPRIALPAPAPPIRTERERQSATFPSDIEPTRPQATTPTPNQRPQASTKEVIPSDETVVELEQNVRLNDRFRPDPFVALPEVMPLPKLQPLNKPVILADVSLDQIDNIELELIDGDEGFASRQTFTRLPPEEDVAFWSWAVRWDDATTAKYSIIDNKLHFNWMPAADEQAVSTLLNSVLMLKANGHAHYAALRKSVTTETFTINLTRPTDQIVCRCEDMPELDKVRVDILGLQNAPRHVVSGAALIGLTVGEEAVVQYSNAPEATTRIKLTNVRSIPAIELESSYRLPSGAVEKMSIRLGNRKYKELQKNLQQNPDSTAARNELQAFNRVSDLARQLHRIVKVRYRFYAFVDGHEVELVTTE